MTEVNREKVERFSNEIIKSYTIHSKLNSISIVKPYSSIYSKSNFVQIAERTLLPKKFFYNDDKYENSVLSSDFGMFIASGEELYFLSNLTDLSRDGKIPRLKAKGFTTDDLIEVINKVDSPTDIFIPIKTPFWDLLHTEFLHKGLMDFEGVDSYIRINGRKIRLHWSTKARPFDDVIVINKNGIEVVQKQYEDMNAPKWLGSVIYTFGVESPIRLDFAESKNPNYFDFYYRTIMLIDNIKDGSVCFLELPETE